MWVHASVHAYWKGALNHRSSIVIDLEVDVNVKVFPKGPAVFILGVRGENLSLN